MQRCVVIRTDRLGELMLTLPAVQALRDTYPHARIAMLVQQEYVDLIRMHPAVDDVYGVQWGHRRAGWRDMRAVVHMLQEGLYDTAIVTHPHKWLHWAVWRAGIARRVGYDRKWAWCLTDRMPDRKWQVLRHEVEWNCDLMLPLGVYTPRATLRVNVSDFIRESVRRRLSQERLDVDQPILAVHPWASRKDKCWPIEHFAYVMNWWMHASAGHVVIIGAPEHAEVAHQLSRQVPGALNVSGQLTLPELAGVLKESRSLLSNDSGPAHVAAAVGTPTVTLFGSPRTWQGPIRWRPWGDGHQILHRVPVTRIEPAEVLEALQAQRATCLH